MSLGIGVSVFLCLFSPVAVSQVWQPFLSISDPQFDISSNFGEEVHIHGDTLVVSAPSGSGAVHLFARNTGGADQWELFQTILPEQDQTYGNQNQGAFGDGLAYNGAILFIGSERGVWNYIRNQDGLFVRFSTVESDASQPPVKSLDLEDSLLVRAGTSFLGALNGGVAVYRRYSSEWLLVDATAFNVQLAESCYGQQAFIKGNRVVVTDPCYAPWSWSSYEGQVHVYRLDEQLDSLIQVFSRSEPSTRGLSSSIAFDGDTILVGDLPNEMGSGWASVFAYAPDSISGYTLSSSYSGYLGIVGGQEILLGVGQSLHVDEQIIIAGTSNGLAFLQKDPMADANWTLLRSDLLAGAAQRVSRSREWMAVGMPSVATVQLYHDVNVGIPEVYGNASIQSFPIPAIDEVSVVIPCIEAEIDLAQLWDSSGRLCHTVPIRGRTGTLRLARMPDWHGMNVLKLIDVHGRIIACTKIIWE